MDGKVFTHEAPADSERMIKNTQRSPRSCHQNLGWLFHPPAPQTRVCSPFPLEQTSISSSQRSRFPGLFLAGTRSSPWPMDIPPKELLQSCCPKEAWRALGHATLLCYSQALPAAVGCLLNKQE